MKCTGRDLLSNVRPVSSRRSRRAPPRKGGTGGLSQMAPARKRDRHLGKFLIRLKQVKALRDTSLIAVYQELMFSDERGTSIPGIFLNGIAWKRKFWFFCEFLVHEDFSVLRGLLMSHYDINTLLPAGHNSVEAASQTRPILFETSPSSWKLHGDPRPDKAVIYVLLTW